MSLSKFSSLFLPCLVVFSSDNEVARFNAFQIFFFQTPLHLAAADRADHQVLAGGHEAGVADQVADRIVRVARRSASEAAVGGNPRSVAICATNNKNRLTYSY